ncbi:Uncharacterised protein [Mycobacteroides abscessus subsp. abscessus]|nr:Uncharacterised protein [Mycobacteroides abscessus subsp. abscessus]SKW67447.1 Uncharacterised protein [Mycobacteroides abscessus subsp. abscessus]
MSIPIAVMRPSRRLAKSHKMSASLVGPSRPGTMRPRSPPPRPGSITMRLPDSCGPALRTCSVSRIACAEPPVTWRPSSWKDRNVSGPQMPSAVSPYSRW